MTASDTAADHAPNWVRAAMHPVLGLDHLPLRVLVCLAAHANRDGQCYPSVPTIAAMVRATDRRVQIALRVLEAAGVVVVEGRGPGGSPRRRLVLPPEAFAPIPRDQKRRPRGATPRSPLRGTGNIDGDAVVITDADVHPSQRPRQKPSRGDAGVARTGDLGVAPLETVGGDAQSHKGRRPEPQGATPRSPEVLEVSEVGVTRTSAREETPPTPVIDSGPDDVADRASRHAAWIDGGGRLCDPQGKDLAGEIETATRGHAPPQIVANMRRWGTPTRPIEYPSTQYAKHREAEEQAAAERATHHDRMRRERERAARRAVPPSTAPARVITAAEVGARADALRGPLGRAWRALVAASGIDAHDAASWLLAAKVWPRRVAGSTLHLRAPTELFADRIAACRDRLLAAAPSAWPEVTELVIELAGDPLTDLAAAAATA